MKLTGILLIIVSLSFAISRGVYRYSVSKEYEAKISCYWDLSEKAATIAQKSEYMDKFVAALDKQNLYGVNDAIFYPTNQNSFDYNMKALKSLQKRLRDISKMDENSFAYQTAIQQITQQEQGEAGAMISTLHDCWQKVNYYTLWNDFYMFGFVTLQALLLIAGLAILSEELF